MKLTSNPSSSNMTYALEIKSGDMVLSLNTLLTPQVYWSMGKERRKIINRDGAFVYSDDKDGNSTWIAVLGNNGVITFSNLGTGASGAESSIKIPNDQCATPEPCGSYYVCSGSKVCGCVSGLSKARSDCKSGIASPCKKSTENNATLLNAGDRVDYFALEFATPFSKKTNIDRCKEFCNKNCSCLGLFFQNGSGDCFLFDWIGSFRNSGSGGSGYVSYIKVANNGAGGGFVAPKEDGTAWLWSIFSHAARVAHHGTVAEGVQ
ncbi:hypothetical protein Bca52824_093333 [Brassica carinata]|uniref:Apple domain-containing protein n=1 Tax=Brassica carinata TaxID=52824 RepID=A0A8X7TKB8_BRACI|nr:hypothetical protein Bca52824_093333 [Brassica carinata]